LQLKLFATSVAVVVAVVVAAARHSNELDEFYCNILHCFEQTGA